MLFYILRDTSSLHGSLIVGMEHRITQLETKMSDVDARASEEADCNANDRDLDRFIYSGSDFIIFWKTIVVNLIIGLNGLIFWQEDPSQRALNRLFSLGLLSILFRRCCLGSLGLIFCTFAAWELPKPACWMFSAEVLSWPDLWRALSLLWWSRLSNQRL